MKGLITAMICFWISGAIALTTGKDAVGICMYILVAATMICMGLEEIRLNLNKWW